MAGRKSTGSIRVLNQNLRRRLACTFRIGFATVGSPNCVLPTMVLTAAKVTRLRTLVALIRQSRFSRSPHMNVRPMPASSRNCRGPVIEFIDAVYTTDSYKKVEGVNCLSIGKYM